MTGVTRKHSLVEQVEDVLTLTRLLREWRVVVVSGPPASGKMTTLALAVAVMQQVAYCSSTKGPESSEQIKKYHLPFCSLNNAIARVHRNDCNG